METTTSKAFGYARVSTTSQSTDRQFDALATAAIDSADIYSDKISGARQRRPGLDDLLSRARSGGACGEGLTHGGGRAGSRATAYCDDR